MGSHNDGVSEEIEMQSAHATEPSVTSRSFFQRNTNRLAAMVKSANDNISKSAIGRFFRLDGCGHSSEIRNARFSTEVRAGLTTFATMSYIIAVNSSILADSGFDCVCNPLPKGIEPKGSQVCGNQDEYDVCINDVKLDLVTATAIVGAFSSILFGITTNLPVALAPGMGLNAYFTYQVVGIRGTGPIPYKVALMAVFIEGWIFLVLALTGMRQWLVRVIPASIKTASGVGIGLFLTLIGLSYSSGIGFITGGVSTPLAIGGCPAEYLDSNGECTQQVLTNPKMWVGILFGGIFTAFLMAFRVKSAIVIGIVIVSIISWPRSTPLTYFPNTAEGNQRWEFFKQIVAFHPIKHTMGKLQWDLSGAVGSRFAIALVTFLYVDIIDCSATLYSMARFCNRVRRGERDFPRSTLAFCTDAICISLGALLGCSPVTAFIESGAGVAEGGRTGLTAIVCGLCFLSSIFFAPIFASIPPWATGSTLVLVGCLMIRQVTRVNWMYIGDAIPAFVTLSFIPFSYSVAYGLMAGMFTYCALNTLIWVVIKLSGGAVLPTDYDQKEYWTWKPESNENWLLKLFSLGRRWKEDKQELKQNPGFPLTGEGDSLHHPPSEEKIRDKVPSPRPFRVYIVEGYRFSREKMREIQLMLAMIDKG
ncbi:hypothetical protein OQA88_4926 [Cercophora sp. LCS_1]